MSNFQSWYLGVACHTRARRLEVLLKKTHLAAAGLFALGAVLMPSTALAAPPMDLESNFTDDADIASNDAEIESALDAIPGDDLWIVTVDNTDGKGVQEWAVDTHSTSGLERHDGVFVVSIENSEVGWHAPGSAPGVSHTTIDKALTDEVMEMFSAGNWDEGLLSFAQNVEAVVGGDNPVVGGPEPFPWLAVGGGALAVAGGAAGVSTLRKRRSAAELESSADKKVQIASSELLATDDEVRAATAELEFARAEFGLEATQDFQKTLVTAREATQEAFQIHGQLHDVKPETPKQKESMAAKISELVTTAQEALAEHTKQFSQLRDLAANADSKVAEIETRISEIAGRSDLGRRTLKNLEVNYPASALETLRTYPDQVAHLLQATEESLTAAREELEADDRNGAVPYIRMAEGTLNQASQLNETVLDAPRVLEEKQQEVAKQIESLSSDIADANRLAADDASVTPLRVTAEEVVRRANAGQTDPFRIAEELHDAETNIDLALEPFRQADENRKKLELDAERARGLAATSIREADQAISRYRSSTRSGAREQLSRAESDYAAANALSDPQEKIRLYVSARQAANRARQAVFNDIDQSYRNGPYGSGRYRSSGDDSFAGAMAGSIIGGLARGMILGGMSGGFGGSSGRSRGGFGGGFGGGGSFGGGGGATGGRRGF